MQLLPYSGIAVSEVSMSNTVWVQKVSSDELEPVPGLEGTWHRWLNPSTENRAMVFGMGQLLPNEVAGWHEHPEPEIFFVLEGQGEARWKEGGREQRAALLPGVAFFKVGGISHQMVNLGTVPLKGVFFKVAVA
jgi:quercetin dioxygenase-like cupin family protein